MERDRIDTRRNKRRREGTVGMHSTWSGEYCFEFVLCFYAGLGSNMHLSLWVPNNRAGSLCSHGECPAFKHLFQSTLRCAPCAGEEGGPPLLTAPLAPSFCATHAFHATAVLGSSGSW